MLRPKKSVTPFWVWGTTAACCYRLSTNTLQASSNAWAKTALIPVMRTTATPPASGSFLEYEYRVKDIAFKELKREFIEKFVVYLSSVQGMRSGTIHSTIKKLKLMTYTAYKNGWIAVDPFAGFHVRPKYAERRYLSASELQAVMDVELPNYRTGINRDAFVFCAFTG